MENEKLEKMYDEYYMTAEGLDKSYIRETLALNLTEGYEKGYSTIQKIFKPEELKRLLGVCAAYYMKKIDNDTYVNAIAKFKIRIRELESKTAADREVKEMLHKMIDAISDKVILSRAYTFIKYLDRKSVV